MGWSLIRTSSPSCFEARFCTAASIRAASRHGIARKAELAACDHSMRQGLISTLLDWIPVAFRSTCNLGAHCGSVNPAIHLHLLQQAQLLVRKGSGINWCCKEFAPEGIVVRNCGGELASGGHQSLRISRKRGGQPGLWRRSARCPAELCCVIRWFVMRSFGLPPQRQRRSQRHRERRRNHAPVKQNIDRTSRGRTVCPRTDSYRQNSIGKHRRRNIETFVFRRHLPTTIR